MNDGEGLELQAWNQKKCCEAMKRRGTRETNGKSGKENYVGVFIRQGYARNEN